MRALRGPSIEELKEDVSIEEVLRYFGADPGGNRRGGWGDWQSMSCPFCKDSNGSASINRQLNRFNCHQCGAPGRDGKSGDIFDVAKYGMNFNDTKDAIEWITRTFR